MDLGAVRTLALDANYRVHGVDATVEVEGAAAITARLIWLDDPSVMLPEGGAFQRAEPVRIACVRRSEVARLPRGSKIVAPERAGGDDLGWLVDGTANTTPEEHRVSLVLDPDYWPPT